MFDVAPSELMLVILVALVVIGPKDLPRVLQMVGKWVGKARGVAAQFRSGFDEMVREAELADLEKKWAAENDRIMRETPPAAAENADMAQDAAAPSASVPDLLGDVPVMKPKAAPKKLRKKPQA